MPHGSRNPVWLVLLPCLSWLCLFPLLAPFSLSSHPPPPLSFNFFFVKANFPVDSHRLKEMLPLFLRLALLGAMTLCSGFHCTIEHTEPLFQSGKGLSRNRQHQQLRWAKGTVQNLTYRKYQMPIPQDLLDNITTTHAPEVKTVTRYPSWMARIEPQLESGWSR